MADALTGGCACGAVRYQFRRAPIIVNACHCRDCQRATGSAFALNALIEGDALEVTGCIEEVAIPGGKQWRCPLCQLRLFGDHPLMVASARFVFVGTLDTGERLLPDAHFFVRSKHAWLTLPANVPCYDTLPDEDNDVQLPADRAARMAAVLR